jgi:hypothetical protein
MAVEFDEAVHPKSSWGSEEAGRGLTGNKELIG